MRIVKEEKIKALARRLIKQANIILPGDVFSSLNSAARKEKGLAADVLNICLDNADFAAKSKLPLCQDTGMAVFFVDIGESVFIEGDLNRALNSAVKEAYKINFLRKSVIKDPLFNRVNTKDNTPAIIHTRFVKGNKLKITFMPKGAGAENMSALAMLPPSAGKEGAVRFVLDTVKKAGANACPPMVIGVGIGGNFEECALLAKRALLRRIKSKHKNKNYAALEAELLKLANKLDVGPQGFGGKTTALGVFIEAAACHMAALPVAVNITCHSHRHAEGVL